MQISLMSLLAIVVHGQRPVIIV